MVVMLLASHAWQHARDRCARGQIEMYKCKLGDRRQIFIHLTLHAKAESCNAAMKHVRARMHTRAHLPAGVSHQHVPFKAEPRLFIHIFLFYLFGVLFNSFSHQRYEHSVSFTSCTLCLLIHSRRKQGKAVTLWQVCCC